jgi:hypothetical protein
LNEQEELHQMQKTGRKGETITNTLYRHMREIGYYRNRIRMNGGTITGCKSSRESL